MLHSPVPKSKTGHRQHSGAATNDHHRHVPLICVLLWFQQFHLSHSPSSGLSIASRSHVGVWDDDQPTCLIIPRSTDTAGAVRSHFRYCVDDDSIKTCHWTSASFYGSGYITRTFASCCGQGSVLPARVALSASLFVGLGICTIGLLLDVWPTSAVHFRTSSFLFGTCLSSIIAFSGGIGDNPSSSPSTARKGNRRRKFIPRKAAVALTPKARTFFKSLLENATAKEKDGDGKQSDDAIIGIQLTYSQSTTGEPRMVFGFSFLRGSALHPNDEAISLEVLEDGETAKPPAEALEDDKEGNVMDPNA